MAVEAILFDFFGTLVEYQPDVGAMSYPAAHRMAQDLGYRHDYEHFLADWTAATAVLEAAAVDSHVEYSMAESAAAFARRARLEVDSAAVGHLGAAFLDEWQRHVVRIAGMDDMVRRLSAAHRLAVVSNTHDPRMVPEMLAAFGIDSLFDAVVLSVDVGHRKPHESIYRHALSVLDVEPSDAVFVGDSPDADYHAPKALGMTAYLIDPNQRPPAAPSGRLASVLDLESRLSS